MDWFQELGNNVTEGKSFESFQLVCYDCKYSGIQLDKLML